MGVMTHEADGIRLELEAPLPVAVSGTQDAALLTRHPTARRQTHCRPPARPPPRPRFGPMGRQQ